MYGHIKYETILNPIARLGFFNHTVSSRLWLYYTASGGISFDDKRQITLLLSQQQHICCETWDSSCYEEYNEFFCVAIVSALWK